MFSYVDVLCLLPFYMYPKTHTARARHQNYFNPNSLLHQSKKVMSLLFNLRKHIYRRCCFYHIRDLRHIRRYIALSVVKTIGTTLITSRLDYCNSLLYNIAPKDILKPQCIQNYLARVVTWSPRFSHSVPLLISLHWLLVQSSISFRLCTIVYKAISSGEPS